MKKAIIILFVLVILLGVPGFFVFQTVTKPLTVDGEIKVEINEGDTFYTVLNEMQSANQVKLVPVIKVYLKVTGSNMQVLPGTYKLTGDMSLPKIVEIITGESGSGEVSVTIQEGFNIEEIGAELEKNEICSKTEFIEATKKYPLPNYIKTEISEVRSVHGNEIKDKTIRYPLEGYLYPETYKIRKGTSPEKIIEMMIVKFEEMLAKAEEAAGYTLNKENGELARAIVKASIIEKESRVNEERPKIAAVINNRLSIDMPLQIDATVNYAKGEHSDVTTLKDLETLSVYNTYQVYGLPPSAICNPRMESIVAAISPDEGTLSAQHVYYILEPGTDKHFFTASDEEFAQKREEWGYNDI